MSRYPENGPGVVHAKGNVSHPVPMHCQVTIDHLLPGVEGRLEDKKDAVLPHHPGHILPVSRLQSSISDRFKT